MDLPSKVTPLEPGEPVPAQAGSVMGSTFAERKAAAEAEQPKDEKSVEQAENKSVGRKRTSRK